jgi:hypothetical protein
MDGLRQVAEKAELVHAVACIELLKSKMLESPSAIPCEVAAALATALNILGPGANGCRLAE